MEETLTHLNEAVEFIKGIAPDVWAIYVRQQYVDAGCTILALFVAIALFNRVWLRVRYNTTTQYNGKDRWANEKVATCIAGWVIVGTLLLIVVAGSIPRLFNPAYYAIKELLP